MSSFNKKLIYLIVIASMMASIIIALYSSGSKALVGIRTHSYLYGYSVPKNLISEDVSNLSPARAVPVLMYHGVIGKGEVNTNTSRKIFVSQMEMLKRKGYESVSVEEYHLFRDDKFVLPPKPFIITFDDGRKDSFYTVDKVLEELGFKATMFVATIKANEGDPFYLSWEELEKAKNTGRWEIEAHGRRSHEEIIIDEIGTLGRYYTSRQFVDGRGLESPEDYLKRVEEDYIYGVKDLEEHLGIKARYFAVPLGEFGDFDEFKISEYEYTSEFNFNRQLASKYFKLAFLQAAEYESFFNYRDSNPYKLKRLDVGDMSVEEFSNFLEKFGPKSLPLVFNSKENGSLESFQKYYELIYGNLEVTATNGMTLGSSISIPSARVLFGDRGWENFSIRMSLLRERGRSVSVLVRYVDEENFISLNWSDQSFWLSENSNGKKRELTEKYLWKGAEGVELEVAVDGNYIRAIFGGVLLADGIYTKVSHGAPGLGVWDPQGARATVKKLEIFSLD